MGMSYLILAGAIMLVSWLISNTLKNKFEKYSKIQLQNGMSGQEIAEKMLADHGIRDVKVISVAGQLTDHYDPTNRTVNLSEGVYNERNAAAAAGAVRHRPEAPHRHGPAAAPSACGRVGRVGLTG